MSTYSPHAFTLSVLRTGRGLVTVAYFAGQPIARSVFYRNDGPNTTWSRMLDLARDLGLRWSSTHADLGHQFEPIDGASESLEWERYASGLGDRHKFVRNPRGFLRALDLLTEKDWTRREVTT